MQNQPNNINDEIDRILSCNIREEILSGIPIELLQSPVVMKSQPKYELQSSERGSERKTQIEEDLYEKAEQIFRLKEVLENELANINEIVLENQKLTEANQLLKTQIKQFQSKPKKLQLHSQILSERIEPFQVSSKRVYFESMSQTQMDFNTLKNLEQLQTKIYQLNQKINYLESQKKLYSETINQLKRQKIQETSRKSLALQEKSLNSQQQSKSIEKYSSIFLKSIFQPTQNLDQTIKKALYSSQKSIFDQLQEAKYFGKIVSRTKNGNAIEQYKNSFQYEGRFLKNHRHGLGKLFYKNKLVYAGQWRQGKFEGKGIIFYYLNLNVQKIEGTFKDGKLEGFGSITFKSGQKIRAFFKNNAFGQEAMIVPIKDDNNLTQVRNSFLGNILFNENKENSGESGKISFKTHEGQLFSIN